jgi:polysaccharide export outer membrane protein
MRSAVIFRKHALAIATLAALASMTPAASAQSRPDPVLPGATAVRPAGQAMASGGVFPIGAGDLVSVSVFDTPELSGQLRVDPNGNVSIPLLGQVHVAGMRTDEAQKVIEDRLVKADLVKEPQVSVFIQEYATQGVAVWGEVKQPAVYPALGNRRLSDVLSMAGGVTPVASTWASVIRREDPAHPIRVDLRSLSADNGTSMELRPGDTVQVDRAGLVYVVGDVAKPGGFVMDSGKVTVLQALALAQGANRTAKLSNARIVRKDGNGATDAPIELQKIMSAKAADVELQPGDILFVPSSAAKSAAAKGLQGILQAAVGVAIYSSHP